MKIDIPMTGAGYVGSVAAEPIPIGLNVVNKPYGPSFGEEE